MSDQPDMTPDLPESRAAATAARVLGILDRHLGNTEDKKIGLRETHRLLARAQLKGWIVYPGENDTPASVSDRGFRLEQAIEAGDEATVKELGIRARAGGRPKKGS